MKTAVCKCGRRFNVQDWKTGADRDFCTTCVEKYIDQNNALANKISALLEIGLFVCDDCREIVSKQIEDLSKKKLVIVEKRLYGLNLKTKEEL